MSNQDFIIVDGVLEKYTGNDTVVIIPDSVTSIDSCAFRNCTSLTSVTIPDSVTSIGDEAFKYCTSLTSVTIPDSVTSIGDWAFYECRRITSVTIPDSVTSIGFGAFYDCTSLTSITIPDSVTSIGSNAFNHCKSLTSVTIPDSVTSIGDWAFFECRRITSVTIGDSVTSIGNHAFSSCNSLTSVTIGDSVTSIGNHAFSSCNSLTNVTIGNSVTSIGEWVFDGCTSLTSITAESNNEYYSSDEYGVLFNKDKTTLIQYPVGNTRTSYTIPDSVTSIGSGVFRNSTSLTSVTIPDSVTSIGSSAFEDCTSLTSVTIPDSVTSIGSSAFEDCTSLTSVTIPDSVTSIGNSAFWKCKSLKEILIPDSVTSIGEKAFDDCKNLKEIFIPDSVKTIGSFAFERCESLEKVKLPKGLKTISEYMLCGCKSLTEIVIPEKVKKIDYGAFCGCSSIKQINIPNGVKSLGGIAFSGCPLEELDIPASVTKIDGLQLGYNNIKKIIIRAESAKVSKELFYRDWTSESKGNQDFYKDTIEKFKSIPPVEIYCTLETKATMPKNFHPACIDLSQLDGSATEDAPKTINIYKIDNKFLADQIIGDNDPFIAYNDYVLPKNKIFKIKDGTKEIKVKTKFGTSLKKFKNAIENTYMCYDMYIAEKYLLSREEVIAKIDEIDPNRVSDAYKFATSEVDRDAPHLNSDDKERLFLITGYIAEKLLDDTIIKKIYDEMPKKKDGSFTMKKIVRIASSRIVVNPRKILEITAEADTDTSFVISAEFRKFNSEELFLLEYDFISRNSNILGLKFE